MPKKIYLVDWNSFIYRMFFGLPEFSTKDWKIVNAIFGMAKFFVVQLVKENPDYLIFIKDAKWKNFRHDLYEDYKATRDRMPDNLRDQIGDIEHIINKMWVDIIEIPWYEADDVIWTLATKYSWNKDYEIDILTWDKDLYSLVSENVCIYDTMKKKKFWQEETREKFGVDANMVVDYLSIVWDKSDNIPWIDWFWPKKAVDLINIIGWVEEIYKFALKPSLLTSLPKGEREKISSCFKWKTFEKLISSKENAFLSKRLATLDKNVNLENFDLEKFAFKWSDLLNGEVKEIFKKFEFHSLLWEEKKDLQSWKDLNLEVKSITNKQSLEYLFERINNPPQSYPRVSLSWAKLNSPWSFNTKGGSNKNLPLDLKEGGGRIKKIVLDTETTSLDIIEAELVWVSIYLDNNHIYYINRLHNWPKVNDKDLKDFLNKLLDLDILIIGHNIKYDLEIIELFLKWESSNLILIPPPNPLLPKEGGSKDVWGQMSLGL